MPALLGVEHVNLAQRSSVNTLQIDGLKGGSKTQPAPSENPQNHADLANTCFFSDSGEADRKLIA